MLIIGPLRGLSRLLLSSLSTTHPRRLKKTNKTKLLRMVLSKTKIRSKMFPVLAWEARIQMTTTLWTSPRMLMTTQQRRRMIWRTCQGCRPEQRQIRLS